MTSTTQTKLTINQICNPKTTSDLMIAHPFHMQHALLVIFRNHLQTKLHYTMHIDDAIQLYQLDSLLSAIWQHNMASHLTISLVADKDIIGKYLPKEELEIFTKHCLIFDKNVAARDPQTLLQLTYLLNHLPETLPTILKKYVEDASNLLEQNNSMAKWSMQGLMVYTKQYYESVDHALPFHHYITDLTLSVIETSFIQDLKHLRHLNPTEKSYHTISNRLVKQLENPQITNHLNQFIEQLGHNPEFTEKDTVNLKNVLNLFMNDLGQIATMDMEIGDINQESDLEKEGHPSNRAASLMNLMNKPSKHVSKVTANALPVNKGRAF